MELGYEIALSQSDSLSKTDSLLLSDRNKLRDETAGKILNPTPLSRFNPYDNKAKKPGNVLLPRFNPYDNKAKKTSIVGKLASVVEVNAPVVQENEIVSVVQGKAPGVVQEMEKAPDDSRSVISAVVSDLTNENVPSVVQEKEKVPVDVGKDMEMESVVTYKSQGKRSGKSVGKNKALETNPSETRGMMFESVLQGVPEGDLLSSDKSNDKGLDPVFEMEKAPNADEKKKISKSNVVLKRKRGDSSGSDKEEDITLEDKGKKKMKGKRPLKIKKDDSPEDVISDDVMKQLLKNMTTPTALHTAIHGIKKVNVEKFLAEIGFTSFYKFDIDYIPSRLGRYVVKNFDEKTCLLKLADEKSIEATVSKVHDLLGIPIGGVSLLSLETRPVEDKFEEVWKSQFEPKKHKKIRVNDIALKLTESKEVDFLFKINFLTLFTNTMDSTNYKKLHVVRTRPTIKRWSSFLMAQRQDMELKEEYIGMSELYVESELPETEGFIAGGSSDTSFKEELLNNLEENLYVLSNERTGFEEMLAIAGLEFPGDLKLIELHKKYLGYEIALSQSDSLSKTDSLLLSDRNKLRDETAGVLKATSSGKILNPTPLSRFNPYDNKAKKPGNVLLPRFNPYDNKAKKTSIVGKLASVVEVNATVVQENEIVSVVQGKAPGVVQEIEKAPDDSRSVISAVVSDLTNENVPSVVQEKEKVPVDVSKDMEKERVVTYKSQGKRSGKSVGKNKALETNPSETRGMMFESVLQGVPEGDLLSSDKSKDKGLDPVKSKDKTTTKSLEKESVKALSEAPILRLEKPVQEETQPKWKLGLSKVDKSTKKPKLKVKKAADEKKKISKSNVVLKRKRGDSSGSDKEEDITPEDKGKKKMKGKRPLKIKKDDSPEDVISDDVMKQLLKNMLKNPSAKDYLSKLPILQARTTPTALHTAIHGIKKVNVEKFLAEIGFTSFYKFDINYIPSRLGRYVVKNFDEKTCRLKLADEKSIEATVSKVHDLLGIPIGGVSLLSLETRPVEDKFEEVWKSQFEPKKHKKIRVNDIALKLTESKEVDFLFKINFLTLFTNTMGMCAGLQGEINLDVVKRVREYTDISGIDWCEYIFHSLKNSKAPTTVQNKYTGPYTLLALLYLDSTNYKKLHVVRTRPTIKQWSSFLMAQRQDMELKEEYIGMSELYVESELPETEGFIAGGSSDTSFKEELLNNLEENLYVLSNERTGFEEMLAIAGLEFPGDLKLIELHKNNTFDPVFVPPAPSGEK
ncbi:hypothetical protein CTI12_AA135790 [Artemisia annua]|uniref:Ulp1 protease family, C-terminal catalytic domain-containing protein n=1 Tax=Artemisia annua TaxID=35608 RepID=A0A2U1PHS0_ARTAN|nr:hypothetical protein CTI12_AA135790 [Artemisia annua]